MFDITPLQDALLSAVLLPFFLFLIEFLSLRYVRTKHKLNRKTREILSYAFNWSFPLNRPFTLFCLPLFVQFLLSYVILYPEINSLVLLLTFSMFLRPLSEEIVFRGFIFGSLLKRYRKKRNYWRTLELLLFQAFIFLLPHLPFTKNPLGVFFSGLLFGILFIITGNDVLLPTVVHIASNILIFNDASFDMLVEYLS
ncbi:MAG: CPBP family intramembrane metalloprotease [Nanoarchaeota archaeon]|nr:CPBP family intramembrane metalloprotease [Nanoarchaeota archaeon]